ncbi:ABC transporter substrate-binding protein [uncultured Roseibium sp.]|uniref:ABC transporter substrate-binding protein n=1 Tax=uncultured Roseibium sp. TaxID=1936171 RepID=UPI002637C1DA|nr:ABC transporter substrate-binding protein [uncultured Roseibium sp.]
MKLNRFFVSTALALVLSAGSVSAQDIKVGHLTYHTGEYGGFGEFFDAVTDFALEVINQDPPLGRKLVPIHQDIGTIGEARAARKLVDSENIDILLNAAHNYMSYRDYILEKVKADKGPLLPSVHGGAIEAEFGGNAEEPLFRGSPMDSAQGSAALLHAKNAGKNSVVFVATEAAGSQLQKNAAIKAADKLGIEVLDSIDIQPNQSNYRSVVSKIANQNPEAVIVFSAPSDGGAFVKNAAEAGNSWFIIGTSEWQEPGFIQTASQAAVGKHEAVVLAAFSNAGGPAWDFYEPTAKDSKYIDKIGDAGNSYAIQYYDLLVASALAIEKAGSLDSEAWVAAMYDVTGGDGKVVHTYADGLAAIRAGEEINYDGVTGTMDYTDTGVPAGIYGIFRWTGEDTLEQVAEADGKAVLELDQ